MSKTPFMFVGENMALDLVNTEKIVRKKRIDLLQTQDDLSLWWETVQTRHEEIDRVDGDNYLQYDDALLELIKLLRDNLRRLFEGIAIHNKPDEASIQYLNHMLQRGHPILVWEQDNQPQLSHHYGNDPYAPLLLPIALSALKLITRADLDRLHRCENNNCILMFYDTTKSGTRRYCTTACMDRERSARRYREAKKRSS